MTSDLDRWLATELMGWYLQDQMVMVDTWKEVCGYFDKTGLLYYETNWHPTRDLNQAYQCAEKMREKGWPEFRLEYGNPETELGLWYCDFVKPDVYTPDNWAEDPNPAQAIAKAIKAALEGK